ncbi:hypothetical protein KUTeg_021259 [Tegillarca granosa]|uniref:VWA N-terminal domain-containing protein n=1 Tax=Tegillarca granosa TaxID=220873 RepID=A0ABQ9EAC3_TEGGR|nr:hypothetical protein KUTeg_021259 [Tegillarca granosa]
MLGFFCKLLTYIMSNWIYKMLCRLLVLFLVLLIGQAYQQSQKALTQELNISRVLVQQWVQEFGDHIRSLTRLMTAHNRLQEKYSTIIGAASQLDGNAYVRNIARDLEKLLKKKAKAVKRLVNIAQEASENYTYEKHLNFDYLNNKKLVSDIDLIEMGRNLTSSEEYRYIHLQKNDKFKRILVNTSFSTIHVPTNNGVKWSEELNKQFKINEKTNLAWQYFCSSDGFLRIYPGMKWPRNNQEIKNIGDNIDMYIKAATSPKNFSENVTYPEPCFKETMMRANAENKKRMNIKLKTEKIANFRKGLLEAFNLFEKEKEKRGPLCNKAIMLLSDGAPESFYTHVSTLADVQENVQKYLRVMSRPLGIGFVTSIAMPVYDIKNSTFEEGHLLGVMGTDVPIEELKNHITSHWKRIAEREYVYYFRPVNGSDFRMFCAFLSYFRLCLVLLIS